MLGFGFSLGAQVVIARRNGEKQYKDVGKVFYQGLFFLSVFAVIVFILSKLFSPMLFRMTISSESVYQAGECELAAANVVGSISMIFIVIVNCWQGHRPMRIP